MSKLPDKRSFLFHFYDANQNTERGNLPPIMIAILAIYVSGKNHV